jgi:hypothetical protein
LGISINKFTVERFGQSHRPVHASGDGFSAFLVLDTKIFDKRQLRQAIASYPDRCKPSLPNLFPLRSAHEDRDVRFIILAVMGVRPNHSDGFVTGSSVF